jgi:hypothetical protein
MFCLRRLTTAPSPMPQPIRLSPSTRAEPRAVQVAIFLGAGWKGGLRCARP